MVHTQPLAKTKPSVQRIKLRGTPEERAQQYGKQGKQRIQKAVTFYADLCEKKGYNLQKQGQKYVEAIKNYNETYFEQLRIIAKHADVHTHSLIGVNARTEIKSLFENECTAVYAPQTNMLGQNWDWGAKSEEHTVLLDVKRENKPDFTTLTEAGMLAKIGMNSAGLGMCLNALRTYKERSGVPIHILLRSILDQETITQATEKIEQTEKDTAGNILIAQQNGEYIDIEIEHNKTHKHKSLDPIYVHTNHYLAKDITKKDLDIHQSSIHRYKKATEISKTYKGTKKDLLKILYNKDNEKYPILREYYDHNLFGKYGTVLTVLMDLNNKTLYIADNPHDTKKMKKITYNW